MLIVVSEYRFLHTEELPISVENYHNEYLKCLYLDISGRQYNYQKCKKDEKPRGWKFEPKFIRY